MKQMKLYKILWLPVVIIIVLFSRCQLNVSEQDYDIINNQWQQLKTIKDGGLLGERADLWRNQRLWNIAESGYLIDGFENRPGVHPWQGEHIGKWLHAATLAFNVTGDEKLKQKLDEMVGRLLATQLENGYMGTYDKDNTFMALPEGGGWDIWTHRYNLYGLLTYEKYFPNKKVVEACKKMGDLLIRYFGKGKYDLTKYGTRQGISSTTILESVVMLYERTLDTKYLDFAEYIVHVSENNPKLRLMGAMLEKESVVYPGDGKGYQLMANLLGYLRLYRCTGKEKYLKTVLNGWEKIHTNHLLVTGGPWSRHMPYNGNKECFAHIDAFHPEKVVVEGCCDATWIQLNIHLFEFTGEAKYFNEAEITLFNDLYGHQYTDGIEWCYYTAPNEKTPKYVPGYHCCGSSQPRVLEMYSSHLAGVINNKLSINTLNPSTIALTSQFSGGRIKIEGGYPLKQSAKIHFELQKSKSFIMEFRLPANTIAKAVYVNDEEVLPLENSRGFMEIKRKWKNGDMVSIDISYALKAHVQNGEEGKKWIAFTYGPFALAQQISKVPDNEPFKNFTQDELKQVLKSFSRQSGAKIAFTIEGMDITFIPYYQTDSKHSGPRTYFEINNKI